MDLKFNEFDEAANEVRRNKVMLQVMMDSVERIQVQTEQYGRESSQENLTMTAGAALQEIEGIAELGYQVQLNLESIENQLNVLYDQKLKEQKSHERV